MAVLSVRRMSGRQLHQVAVSHTLIVFIVCGSENEVAPIPTEDDHFDVTNRKVQSGSIDYNGQKLTVWFEVVLAAQDQLCQRLAFGLSKIFATSTNTNSDSINSETNIGVYDNFVTSCFSTYRDVMKKASFNQEMSEQCEPEHHAHQFILFIMIWNSCMTALLLPK